MLALTAALVVPPFIDWSNYRAEFEREAGRILGRDVIVRGEASARLLPFPSVTFTQVEVAGASPGEPAITIESFSMDAELSPFMRGELLIFDMRIDRPRARVAIADDGTVDWALRPSTPFDPRQVMLEKVTITEGRLDIVHAAGGRVHSLTELNADIAAQTLAGPWRIAGSARVDGHPTALSVTTGTAERGRMRLRIRAEPERYGFVLDSDGDVGLKDGALSYEGAFRLNARQVQPAAAGTPPPPAAYRTSGKFALDHRSVRVPEFRLETGPIVDPYMADGHAEITLGTEPRFLVVADGAQLRFEQGTGEAGGAIALRDRLTALRAATLALPRPIIPGAIELNLPAIVAGDTTVRDVMLHAEPAEGGWQLEALNATLPGRATLQASGLLTTGEEDFGFSGRMLLAVSQPSGFAAWLSSDVDEAIRRLPSAGFDARVNLSAERQVFEDLELSLGGARFDGRIENRQPANGRGVMTVDLSGGRLDLDGVAAFAALFVGPGGEARLADHDLNFAVRAGPVVVSGLVAQAVETRMRLFGGVLDIDALNVSELEGTTLLATGKVSGIGGGAPAGEINATVHESDLAPLVARAAERLPQFPLLQTLAGRAGLYPGLFEDSNLEIRAAFGGGTGGKGLALDLSGESGGTALSLGFETRDIAGRLTEAPLSLAFTAVNNEPAVLYALAGLPALPLGFAGAATLEATLDGSLADAATASFGFRSEGLELSFGGTLSLGDDRFGADGEARLSATDIEPWLMTAGMSVPGMGLGLPVYLSGKLNLSDGLAVVSGLAGSIAGTDVSGDVNAEMRDGRPHLTGSIETQSLDLALAAEALFGEAAFDGAGEGWPRVPFQPAARQGFTGEFQVSADTLKAGTAATARNARLTARLDKEGVRVFDLSAGILGGTLSGLFEISNNAGTGLFSGQLTLDGAVLPELLPASGLTGTGRFTAALTASGKSVDAMMASLAGSGTASLSDLSIPALRSDALADIIAFADAAGTGVDAEQTAAVAPEIVADGRFVAGGAEMALTIASGVARAPALRIERPDAVLTVEPRADFGRWQVAAAGQIEYVAGEEAVAGGEPVVRFAAEGAPGAVEVSYDTEPLAQYLTQRALEKEQARVEAMQALLLERQRLRREVRYYASLADERVRRAEEQRRAAEEEAARIAAEEAARRAAEAAAARQAAAEAARLADEAAAARRAADEEVARREAEAADAARRAAEAEQRALEEIRRRAAEEAARTAAPSRQPDDNFLPGVERQPLPSLPRAGTGTSGSLFRQDTMNFGRPVVVAAP